MNGKHKPEARREIARNYVKQSDKIEKKYRKGVAKAILHHAHDVIDILKSKGPEAAIKYNDLKVANLKVAEALRPLYMEAGVFFARDTANSLKKVARRKADGRLGTNPKWISRIRNYLKVNLLNDAVVPITETTRDLIQKVLTKGIQSGWGIDELTEQILDGTMPLSRAHMITRTELSKAANIGRHAASEDVEFETQKEWITAGDDRVRDLHEPMDGEIVDMDDDFNVGGESMNGPGDPSASAANVINCRCTLAVIPKRDSNGGLISK